MIFNWRSSPSRELRKVSRIYNRAVLVGEEWGINVPLRSNAPYSFLYVYFFIHSKYFLKILPNLNLLGSLEDIFLTFISENLRPPLIFLFQVLVENLSK